MIYSWSPRARTEPVGPRRARAQAAHSPQPAREPARSVGPAGLRKAQVDPHTGTTPRREIEQRRETHLEAEKNDCKKPELRPNKSLGREKTEKRNASGRS